MKYIIMAIIGVLIVVLGINAIEYITPSVAKATQYLEDRGYQVLSSVLAMDVSDIKAKTDNLPATPANEATSLLIKAKTDLIVSGGATEATLEDVETDVEYAEQHLHHRAVWYGKLASQTATNWCDSNTISSPYIATSGNNAWGTEGTDPAQLFGTGDELTELGSLNSGDFSQIYVIANSSDTLYKLRLIWGTGTVAEAVSAGQYTESIYLRKSTDTVRLPRAIECPVIPLYIGGNPTKVWMECWNASNDATISFYIGAHGYNL